MPAGSKLEFLIGAVLVASGLLLGIWRAVFLARAIRVTGEVIEWVDDPPALPDTDRPFATYRRKIAYRDHTGSLHHHMPWARSGPGLFGGLAVGVPVGVYFIPEMPGWPLIDGPGEPWLPPVLLIAMGGAMLGWGHSLGF